MNRYLNVALGVIILSLTVGCHTSRESANHSLPAGEGMWLPNALPVDRLKRDFDFVPSAAWVEHLQLSSVHIGASGAFVSPDGLVLTNHHVALGGLQSVSRPGKDYVADGFLAKTYDEEIKLPGEELSVLQSIEDVTARVNAAVDVRLPADQTADARNAAIATIEQQSQSQTGLQSRVVTLYGGALYHLYRYKRYNDVRIVFAPEISSAFFGGDPDNFEYPRYCLDIALLRAYENGKPAHVDNYLKISSRGVADGDLVFVSGHPFRTDRLLTAAMLKGMRDLILPLRLDGLERAERALFAYAKTSEEAARQTQGEIFFVQNSLKATRPRLAALKDGAILKDRQREEQDLQAELRAQGDRQHDAAAWPRIAAAEQRRTQLQLPYTMLEERRALNSYLFENARDLVRLAAEDSKPDAQRLPEFTQSKRQSMEEDLFADYPSYPGMEIAKLTASLQFARDRLGADSPIVKQILDGKEPAARAEELVRGSAMGNPAERKRVRAGGAAAIAASTDPMIRLARALDDQSRAVRKAYESEVQEPQTQALTAINRARFALFGTNSYPDATGTLRVGFGVVQGYEQGGQHLPAWTTLGGAFDHQQANAAKPPFVLPHSWAAAHDRLGPTVPLDFVSTADITGGNSGSPMVNRDGELVGVLFDSNRQGVATDFAYSNTQARAIAVDCRGILEALVKIYDARALLGELTGGAGGK